MQRQHNELVHIVNESILTMPDGVRTIDRFTVAELRQQVHICRNKASIGQFMGEDAESEYYKWLGGCLEEALQVLLTRQRQDANNRYGSNGSAEDVKAAHDITDVISRYLDLRKTGKTYTARCPFHDDRHPSFTIYPETQSWYCFSCCRGGDVIDFICLVESTDFKHALSMLNGGKG